MFTKHFFFVVSHGYETFSLRSVTFLRNIFSLYCHMITKYHTSIVSHGYKISSLECYIVTKYPYSVTWFQNVPPYSVTWLKITSLYRVSILFPLYKNPNYLPSIVT